MKKPGVSNVRLIYYRNIHKKRMIFPEKRIKVREFLFFIYARGWNLDIICNNMIGTLI